ncbi:M24 family metallopeptidase [Paenibacillus ginsengarvi]|uniref:Aminopeptidase P family protein n=1 Tax=Paenibacillus ginsengarvi TaxID=400777 RepID=A0A3B0CXG9_9BACL|nr:Xaa-Pro peptidase family protein [Paenibacillus ginsengarvi]RKN86967.1 aminopeptidase P family protein [Paenibacillus ginsengarvi]
MNENFYKQRLSKLQSLLGSTGNDAIVVASAANLFYFTGVWIEAHERLLALVVRSSGETCLLAPDLHRGELADVGFDTVFWRDGEDASKLLAARLESCTNVAVDGAWSSRHLLGLMKHRPNVRWSDGAPLLGTLRQVKDERELELIRRSAETLNRVMSAFAPRIRAGRSESELLDELLELWKREGIRDLSFDPTVATGANGANPHHTPGDSVVREGDLIIIDTGGVLDRYCSDMTRTFCVGEPSEEQRAVYELVKEAHLAGIRAVRPGATLADVDRAARSVIEAGGYGAYFVHRTGHGLGIDVHEEPAVQADNDELIVPGMVFSIEPGVYLPGKFGVRIEDIVIVTENGCESVNAAVSKELTVLR